MPRLRLILFLLTSWSTAPVSVALSVEEALVQDPPFDSEYPAAMAELTISSQGQRLPAHIYLAAGAGPHPTVVLLHGLPGNERNLDIAQALRRFGFNVLYFHYRGAWGAEGRYTVLGQLDDINAVLAWLQEPRNASPLRVDRNALSVLGHSLGGFMALATGARAEPLRCVLALSPANLQQVRESVEAGDGELADLGAYAETLFMLAGVSAASFREDLADVPAAQLDLRLFGPQLRGRALFLAVGADDTVTPAESMFRPLVTAYREIVGLDMESHVLPGDHAFSTSRVALTRRILTWTGEHCR